MRFSVCTLPGVAVRLAEVRGAHIVVLTFLLQTQENIFFPWFRTKGVQFPEKCSTDHVGLVKQMEAVCFTSSSHPRPRFCPPALPWVAECVCSMRARVCGPLDQAKNAYAFSVAPPQVHAAVKSLRESGNKGVDNAAIRDIMDKYNVYVPNMQARGEMGPTGVASL